VSSQELGQAGRCGREREGQGGGGGGRGSSIPASCRCPTKWMRRYWDEQGQVHPALAGGPPQRVRRRPSGSQRPDGARAVVVGRSRRGTVYLHADEPVPVPRQSAAGGCGEAPRHPDAADIRHGQTAARKPEPLLTVPVAEPFFQMPAQPPHFVAQASQLRVARTLRARGSPRRENLRVSR